MDNSVHGYQRQPELTPPLARGSLSKDRGAPSFIFRGKCEVCRIFSYGL